MTTTTALIYDKTALVQSLMFTLAIGTLLYMFMNFPATADTWFGLQFAETQDLTIHKWITFALAIIGIPLAIISYCIAFGVIKE